MERVIRGNRVGNKIREGGRSYENLQFMMRDLAFILNETDKLYSNCILLTYIVTGSCRMWRRTEVGQGRRRKTRQKAITVIQVSDYGALDVF